MNPQGSGWIPSMGMPPLGYGVVMPQQGGNRSTDPPTNFIGPQLESNNQNFQNPSPQVSEYFTQKGMCIRPEGAVNIYAQQFFISPHQQQQWLLAQQKASQEQKVLFEKIKKQRQFDEQKQRLKDFTSCKSKTSSSADDMIQNILNKKESSAASKLDTKTDLSSATCVEKDSNSAGRPLTIPLTTSLTVVSQQPTVYQYPQVNAQFSHHPQPGSSLLYPTLCPPYMISDSYLTLQDQCRNSSEEAIVKSKSTPKSNSSISNGTLQVAYTTDTDKLPLQLPEWLTDRSKIPEVYTTACGLVEKDDGWVDTSRAYMLLMRTNVPPHLLGILWEMVNRSKPGVLKSSEFRGLLALVALIQSGKNFSNTDILTTLTSPIYPFVDHPTLLKLTQEQLQKDQNHQESRTNFPVSVPDCKILPTSFTSSADDEFDDFVSAVLPPSMSSHESATQKELGRATSGEMPESVIFERDVAHNNLKSLSNQEPGVKSLTNQERCSKPSTTQGSCSKSSSNQEPCLKSSVSHKPCVKPSTHQGSCLKSSTNPEPCLNFPTIGVSPLTNRKNKPEVDEFTDFQEAPKTLPITTTTTTSENVGDKYAAFRELTSKDWIPHKLTRSDTLSDEGDDSFGEFCSSRPSLSGEKPLELLYTAPLPDTHIGYPGNQDTSVKLPQNVAALSGGNVFNAGFVANETSSGLSWQKDCFGELEASLKSNIIPADFSSDSSQYITANASVDTSSDPDDDFGDFIGPVENSKDEPSVVKTGSTLNILDRQAETQSVASLELPGLEVTVNLSLEVAKGDHLLKTDFQTDLEDEFCSLSCEESTRAEQITGNDSARNIESNDSMTRENPLPPPPPPPPVGVIPFADKYSIIREEQNKYSFDDPCTDSWRRCLLGSNKLLADGLCTLEKIKDSPLLDKVLDTTQMHDYLSNLLEVREVAKRIVASSKTVTITNEVQELLNRNFKLWSSVETIIEGRINLETDSSLQDVSGGTEGNKCSLCLLSGGVCLVYGGYSYHPPCANFWLNVVDLTLPSLVQTKGNLL